MAKAKPAQKADRTFPRSARLLKRSQFQAVLERGAKVVSPELVVFAQASDKSRLGLIVSKKVGNAVERNVVKRRLREAYRQLENKHSYDVVLIARHVAGAVTYQQLSDSLVVSLDRLRRKIRIVS